MIDPIEKDYRQAKTLVFDYFTGGDRPHAIIWRAVSAKLAELRVGKKTEVLEVLDDVKGIVLKKKIAYGPSDHGYNEACIQIIADIDKMIRGRERFLP